MHNSFYAYLAVKQLMKFSKLLVITSGMALSLLAICCSDSENGSITNIGEKSNEATTPLFNNSIVSTDIDFIFSNDEDAFLNITYLGQADKEMPDSRNDILFDNGTYVFQLDFSLGNSIDIWVHSTFGSENAAFEYANKLTEPIGKLPEFMRSELSHVVLHKGNAGAFAESEANFFVVYSENIDTRISNNDLEETIFHESVHASLDADFLKSEQWLKSQQNDYAFITEYAKENADKEDMAESALFAFTMIKHPGRLSSDIEMWVKTNIPNRYAFFQAIFE